LRAGASNDAGRNVILSGEPAFLFWLTPLSFTKLTYHEPVRTDQHNQEQEQRHRELQILHPYGTAPNKVNSVPAKPTTIPIEPVMSIVFSIVSLDNSSAWIGSGLHYPLR
jgi:hypothetical protein